MLTEAALATLAVIAVAAGIGLLKSETTGLAGIEAWNHHYSSWAAAIGLKAKMGAFVEGSANMLTFIGIPFFLGKIIIGVFVASFAGTTLDSATRIQRYIVTELSSGLKMKVMTGKYAATAFAVITAAALAFATGADGKGALTLWPMFGAVNQLLAALALLVLSIYLKKRGGLKFLVTAIPCVFMLIMTVWSVIFNQIDFAQKSYILLSVINGIMILLAVWMIIEGIIVFIKPGMENGTQNP
jgi:carbon starvation protein